MKPPVAIVCNSCWVVGLATHYIEGGWPAGSSFGCLFVSIILALFLGQVRTRVDVVKYHYQLNLECIMTVPCVMRVRAVHASSVDILMNIF